MGKVPRSAGWVNVRRVVVSDISAARKPKNGGAEKNRQPYDDKQLGSRRAYNLLSSRCCTKFYALVQETEKGTRASANYNSSN